MDMTYIHIERHRPQKNLCK